MTLTGLLLLYASVLPAAAVLAALDVGDEVAADEGPFAAFAVVVILAALWPLFFLSFFVIGLWRGVAWLWRGGLGG